MSGENAERQESSPAPGTVERIRPRQLSERDPAGIAKAIGESGYWKHISNSAQAMVIMAAGEELGLTPLAAVQGITVIEEQIGYRANLIATLIAQHERYSYKVIERKDDRCTLQFEIDGEAIDDGEEGKVTFTLEDAKKAELIKPRSNWMKYPRRMCFWRCLTEGAGIYFADLTAGTPVYTDEEIREIIHVEAEVVEDDSPPATTLPDETVEHLVKGYELAKPALEENGVNALDGLNVRLGALGIDGFNPNESVAEQLAKLTEEQAEAVDADLQALVDQEAGESDE